MDADTIRDIFRSVDLLRIRRMFGGQGIYQGDVMFALEAGGELYLKTDTETVETFRSINSRPFVYTAHNGRAMETSYWLMPDACLDDEDEAARFALLALQAARRAQAAKPAKARAKPAKKRA
ncbi:TfoX/Sxy family protein [Microvirga terricola]|uniref:TfoX/Sxy family protein n=1 Tax=Microvirga terricola TaxID=2719797 RepID=A0ABX0VC24_9HYPH|nr:TfoX/Sxy family protein [Microvirga terricola]NIX77410.1 TfoX/Sxy family protein [Microvirga terricola]